MNLIETDQYLGLCGMLTSLNISHSKVNTFKLLVIDGKSQVGVSGVSPLSVDGSGAVTEEAIQRTIDCL